MDKDILKGTVVPITFAFAICLTIVLCTFAFTGQLQNLIDKSDVITVKGYAEKLVNSDLAEWNFGASFACDTRAEAVSLAEGREKEVREYLQKNGIVVQEISLDPLRITAEYIQDENGNNTNTVDYYVGSLHFKITTTNISLVEKLSRDIVKLNGTGLAISSDSPNFLIKDLEQYKLELLRDATQTAKARAEEIVTAGGRKLGPLKSAVQGVFQVTSPNSIDVSGYGEYDTSTVQKKVSLVVTVQYGVSR
jgi:hypothetical protein